MSIRRNPFEELERLFKQMSNQFEDTSNLWGGGQMDELRGPSESMAVDLVDRDDEYVVTLDVPGFDKDDINVNITDQTLLVKAEHEESMDEEDEDYVRKERTHRSLRRSIRLPDVVDPETVSAKLKNGVLTIMIPKVEPDESARTIEIESE